MFSTRKSANGICNNSNVVVCVAAYSARLLNDAVANYAAISLSECLYELYNRTSGCTIKLSPLKSTLLYL